MPRNKPQQTLPHSVVEDVIVQVFDLVDPDDLTNFQARIRHFRNIGVPRNLPQPGSGRRITYTLDQVLQLGFALCLGQYGVMPRVAADIGPALAQTIRMMRIGNPGDDVYAVLGRGGDGAGLVYTLLPNIEQLKQTLEEQFAGHKEDALLVLNVSNLTRKIEQGFQKQESREDVSKKARPAKR